MKINCLLKESTEKEPFQYEGTCVNTKLFGYDATYMAHAIDDSMLLKPNYLELTYIQDIGPPAFKKFLATNKKFVMGYLKDLLWLYFPHVDKHYFFTADRRLTIPTEYHEHARLDRGTGFPDMMDD